jgi:GT2 family glycosyltransferase
LADLVEHGIQPGVGVVGCKLLYADRRIQHLGVKLGYKGIAGHMFLGLGGDSPNLGLARDNCFQADAVTFACALVDSRTYKAVSGMDERFAVGLNDVDLCIRLSEAEKMVVVCATAELVHHESQTRGNPFSIQSILRQAKEVVMFIRSYKGKL